MKELRIPANIFILDAINYIIKIFNSNQFISTYTYEEISGFLKINRDITLLHGNPEYTYKLLIEKMFYFYKSNPIKNKNMLLIFAFLLGDLKIRYVCEFVHSLNDDIPEREKEFIEKIPFTLQKQLQGTFALPSYVDVNSIITTSIIDQRKECRFFFGEYGQQTVVYKIFLQDQEEKDIIEEYINYLGMNECPEISKLEGYFQNPSRFISLMFEYGTTLHELLLTHFFHFSNDQFKNFILDIVNAIYFLHKEMEITHGNINPSTILIDANQAHAKLAVFSLGEQLHDLENNNYKHPSYIAPEITDNKPTNSKVDIFAFGTLLNELAKSLFTTLTPVIFLDGYSLLDGNTPNYPNKNANHSITKLIKNCLADKPHKRPPIEKIKENLENNNQEYFSILKST